MTTSLRSGVAALILFALVVVPLRAADPYDAAVAHAGRSAADLKRDTISYKRSALGHTDRFMLLFHEPAQ